jgi:molecular chaperone DnaK (HSP70)
MHRILIASLALLAAISCAQASENQPIESKQQCTETADTLEANLNDVKDSIGDQQLEQAQAALKSLREACEKAEMAAAAEAATELRQSIAAEN